MSSPLAMVALTVHCAPPLSRLPYFSYLMPAYLSGDFRELSGTVGLGGTEGLGTGGLGRKGVGRSIFSGFKQAGLGCGLDCRGEICCICRSNISRFSLSAYTLLLFNEFSSAINFLLL
jgi:hypothetical protein